MPRHPVTARRPAPPAVVERARQAGRDSTPPFRFPPLGDTCKHAITPELTNDEEYRAAVQSAVQSEPHGGDYETEMILEGDEDDDDDDDVM
ncbi:unnamed protein product [Boreogadus saida]